MGLSYDVQQLKREGQRLSNSQKAFKRYLIADMNRLAAMLQRLARAMAPYETGSLEGAIFARVIKEGYSGLRVELSVAGHKPRKGRPGVIVDDYSWYMELGKYRLGKRSEQKNANNTFDTEAGVKPEVGSGFLERAVEISEKKFSESIMKRAREAGFTRN